MSDARPARAAGPARAAAGRARRRASTCAAAARWPSTCSRSGTRRTSSSTATSPSRDRELGLEHWVDDIIPTAMRRVSEDAGGAPGAARRLVPGRDHVAAGRSPGDADAADRRGRAGGQPVRLHARCGSWRRCARWPASPDGLLGTAIYRALGGAPAPLVKRAFQLTSIDKYLTKPLALLHAPRRPRVPGPDARRSTASWPTCTPIPAARSASSTTASSASTSWPTGASTLPDRDDRPGRRPRAGPRRSPARSDVLAPRAAVHHVGGAAAQRAARAAGDRARRAPRRAHRPRGPPHDVGVPRRLPRRRRARAARPRNVRCVRSPSPALP